MNSIAPWSLPGHLARSEAFAEDLAEDSSFLAPQPPRVPLLSTALLCAVPVAVALLGGVAAFIHTVG
jgi:hypothetical protein